MVAIQDDQKRYLFYNYCTWYQFPQSHPSVLCTQWDSNNLGTAVAKLGTAVAKLGTAGAKLCTAVAKLGKAVAKLGTAVAYLVYVDVACLVQQ